jgi:hypothetical protein
MNGWQLSVVIGLKTENEPDIKNDGYKRPYKGMNDPDHRDSGGFKA